MPVCLSQKIMSISPFAFFVFLTFEISLLYKYTSKHDLGFTRFTSRICSFRHWASIQAQLMRGNAF